MAVQQHASSRTSGILCVLIALSSMSLIFQLAGFVTSGWQIIHVGNKRLLIGLWYLQECTNENCSIHPISDFENVDPEYRMSARMLDYQTEASFGLIFAFTACLNACIVRCWPGRTAWMVSLVVTLVTAGVMALAASGSAAQGTVQASDMLRTIGVTETFGWPYSLILTGCGGVLDLATVSVFLYFMYRRIKPQNITTDIAGETTEHQ